MVIKQSFIIIVLLSFLYAQEAFIDNDLDGVDDRVDQCPNSLLIDIVDKNGCAIKKLSLKERYYDVALGFSYIKDQDSSFRSQTFSFSYYYDKFSYTLVGSLSQDGFDDVKLSLGYTLNSNHQISFGIYLPVMDIAGNKTDYFIKYKYSYKINDLDLSWSWRYTLMGDDNSKNTNSFTITMGYIFTQNLYSSLSYSYESALYQDSSHTQILSLYFYYSLNEHFYIANEFSYGLNKSALDFGYSFTLGYTF